MYFRASNTSSCVKGCESKEASSSVKTLSIMSSCKTERVISGISVLKVLKNKIFNSLWVHNTDAFIILDGGYRVPFPSLRCLLVKIGGILISFKKPVYS